MRVEELGEVMSHQDPVRRTPHLKRIKELEQDWEEAKRQGDQPSALRIGNELVFRRGAPADHQRLAAAQRHDFHHVTSSRKTASVDSAVLKSQIEAAITRGDLVFAEFAARQFVARFRSAENILALAAI